MENKKAICKALLETLKLTSEYHNLERLDYYNHEDIPTANRGKLPAEFVFIGYDNYAYAVANVEMDSGSAMINDIMKNLHNWSSYFDYKEDLERNNILEN